MDNESGIHIKWNTIQAKRKNGMKICRKMVGLRKCNSEVIECHKGRSHVFPHMQNLVNNRYLWKPCTCGQSRIEK